MSSETTNRWLILEQESDRPDWSEAACDGLVWNESDLIRQRPAPGQSPAEAEICVLFLPPVATGWTLPEQFDNRTQWRWNVWCHYGRDITMGQTATRWTTYERLQAACKARLSVNGNAPPLPFSRSMTTLPWTEEFLQLKEIAKSGGGGADGFRRSLDLLRRAWLLASGEADVQASIMAGKEALPAMLAAQMVLDSLPCDATQNHMGLTRALHLCQTSGLQALAPEKEKFSEPVRKAFKKLEFTIFAALQPLGIADEKIKNGPHEDVSAMSRLRSDVDQDMRFYFDSIREALTILIRTCREDAERTTLKLENPRLSSRPVS